MLPSILIRTSSDEGTDPLAPALRKRPDSWMKSRLNKLNKSRKESDSQLSTVADSIVCKDAILPQYNIAFDTQPAIPSRDRAGSLHKEASGLGIDNVTTTPSLVEMGDPMELLGLQAIEVVEPIAQQHALDHKPATYPVELRKFVKKDNTATLSGLLARKTFRQLLDDPIGLYKFGLFMASELNTEALIFWLRAQQHANELQRLQAFAQHIHDMHIPSEAPMGINISSSSKEELDATTSAFTALADPFEHGRKLAFSSMYEDAFPRFLKRRLAAQASLELEADPNRKGAFGVGDAFCIANAGKGKELALVYLSDGFCRMAGYSRRETIGKSCGILQGPGTSKSARDRMRKACDKGEACVELLLNYNASNTPFWNLVCIAPLYDNEGQLCYYLGAQVNISSLLASSRDMAALLTDELDPFGGFSIPSSLPEGSEGPDMLRDQYTNAVAAINEHIAARLDPPPASLSSRAASGKSKKVSSRLIKPNAGRCGAGQTLSADVTQSKCSLITTESLEEEAKDRVDESSLTMSKLKATPRLSEEGRAAWEARRRPKSTESRRPLLSKRSAPEVGLRSRVLDNRLQVAEQSKILEQAVARFVLIHPTTYAVLFTCVHLQTEFGKCTNFLKTIKNRLPTCGDSVKTMKEAIKQGACLDVHVDQFVMAGSGASERVTIHLVPLKGIDGATAMVVIVFGPAAHVEKKTTATDLQDE